MGRPRNDGDIYVHAQYHYDNDTHIETCLKFCLYVKPKRAGSIDKKEIENFPGNSTLEVTTG